MTKQIESVSLTAPTLGAVTSFYQNVHLHINDATPEKLHLEALAPGFATLVDNLIAVQNKQRAMTGTLSTQEADAQRVAIVNFMLQLVRAMASSPVAAEAQSAARVLLIFNTYPNLSALEQERETTQVSGLLRDLSEDSIAADVLKLNLTGYIEMLDSANSGYVNASQKRSQEAQTRASIAGGETSNSLRAQTAEVYKQIVATANAFALAAPSADMDAFVDKVNGEVMNLKRVIATEKAANTRFRFITSPFTLSTKASISALGAARAKALAVATICL